MLRPFITACLLTLSAPAFADSTFVFPEDQAETDFIANEVIATFYHEVGHGLIDVLKIPVLGKEEDAADTLSVILMDRIWKEEAAAEILRSDAMTYAANADYSLDESDPADFADEHSLDIQRYYAVVCLFYGANPDARRDLAVELELPEAKLESCPDEWAYASGAWDKVLEGTEPGPKKKGLVMGEGQEELELAQLLADEVASLNQMIGLPEDITVWVADCGEANAYYSPDDKAITICNEYAQYLQEIWAASE